ncbi:COX15/CtaA family protein [Pseudomonas saliphila]|uniref:COX15/CtaA family protein n=1 Tax=Pseudomonas saliphila TaxID=2586906 RepID=UPI00123A5BCC|nr:COX15/CtaA family protein [Pseudomonas saliphila]
MRRNVSILALVALALGFVVVILGAYTRLVHAGLGCPDWPGCYGFLSVPRSDSALEMAQMRFPDDPVETFKAWAEMIHRYAAGLLGLLILGLAVLAVRRRSEPGYPTALSLGLLLLVICQALFGMWTVTLKLWPQIVTTHLLGGFATLSLLLLLNLRLSRAMPSLAPSPGLNRTRYLARLVLLVVIGQIALGGWTSSNYAAVACVDLPTCHGEWWPDMNFAAGFNVFQEIGPNYLGGMLDGPGRTAIHFSHRIGAIVTSIVVLLLAWRLFRLGQNGLAGLLLVVLGTQVSLGITNVLAHLPLSVAVAHNAVGAVLLLVMVAVNNRLRASTSSGRELVDSRSTALASN